jgi:hypothetical protein
MIEVELGTGALMDRKKESAQKRIVAGRLFLGLVAGGAPGLEYETIGRGLKLDPLMPVRLRARLEVKFSRELRKVHLFESFSGASSELCGIDLKSRRLRNPRNSLTHKPAVAYMKDLTQVHAVKN